MPWYETSLGSGFKESKQEHSSLKWLVADPFLVDSILKETAGDIVTLIMR